MSRKIIVKSIMAPLNLFLSINLIMFFIIYTLSDNIFFESIMIGMVLFIVLFYCFVYFYWKIKDQKRLKNKCQEKS